LLCCGGEFLLRYSSQIIGSLGFGAVVVNVNVQIIQGLEAGTVVRNVPTPITIGREDENQIQLNDERISRFHAKIQSQGDQLILTDLQSTNGTRVNGHFTRMRTLQIGDQIALGRCILVVGAPEEVALLAEGYQVPEERDELLDDPTEPVDAFPFGPPEIPENLTGVQVAGLATLLEFTRTEILTILSQMSETEGKDEELVHLTRAAWHRLQLLPSQISHYVNHLVDPSESD
jgi:pSer/pThr/pTyr-binding forkhead associated (FHA) protein